MEKFSPARINLLFLNTQLSVLKSGVKLLRSKREALMKDLRIFSSVLESVLN